MTGVVLPLPPRAPRRRRLAADRSPPRLFFALMRRPIRQPERHGASSATACDQRSVLRARRAGDGAVELVHRRYAARFASAANFTTLTELITYETASRLYTPRRSLSVEDGHGARRSHALACCVRRPHVIREGGSLSDVEPISLGQSWTCALAARDCKGTWCCDVYSPARACGRLST